MSKNAMSFRSPRALVAVFCLTLVMAIFASMACGSDTGGSRGGGAPAEGSGGDPRIRSVDGTYSIDDLKITGGKNEQRVRR